MCKKLIFLTSFVLVLALACTNVAFGDVIEIRVDSSDDDEEEYVADGTHDWNSSDLEITEEGEPANNQLIGLRFNNVDVPQGASITSAYVQFTCDETDVPGDNRPGTKFLRGEAVDNAATFSNVVGDIASRPTTSAEASWDWPLWLNKHEAGPDQQTSDISAVIQEIVDRPGWSAGNSLALIISGSGENTAEAFDGELEFEAAPPLVANITLVTTTRDIDLDGVQDDQGLIDWLVAEGHNVDVRPDYWNELDLEPEKVDELNAADLVIISRSTGSGDHDDGDEPTLWNSVTSPMITVTAYLPRSSRWLWMNTASVEQGDAILLASDPNHPVFDGVTFEMGNMVIYLDNTVGSGLTTFIASTDVGNGTLIASALGADYALIAEWAAGVEFYEGSGQIAGGRRMLFTACTQETDVPLTPWGAFNLTPDGEQMFRNAIAYMLIPPPPSVIWVSSTRDYDLDGVQDDQGWIDLLEAEGYNVDVRLDYWNELDLEPNKVDELNAADLVIISRSTSSGDHDDGDEPTLWNSVTTPLITTTAYLPRSTRWLWMNTGSADNTDAILLASDTTHPVFDGVTFEMGNMVIYLDNTVGSGHPNRPGVRCRLCFDCRMACWCRVL
jgi:hypothetical protein